jgi:hypothetical protein
MSGLWRSGRSTERIARDDRALDAAGQGAEALDHLIRTGGATRDPVLAMLAQWHDEVSDGADTTLRGAAWPAAAPAGDPSGTTGPPVRPRRRIGRLLVAASAAVLATALLGGVAVGAAGAGPGSPLWPVTRAVYPGQADSREHQAAAQRDLDDAQQAAAAGDTAGARHYLDDAGHHLAQVRPSAAATRLRQRADQMRRHLDASTGSAASTTGPGSPRPAAPSTGESDREHGNGKNKPPKAPPSPAGQPGTADGPSLDAATVNPTDDTSKPPPDKVKPSKTKKPKR